jgi:hypothetical protein
VLLAHGRQAAPEVKYTSKKQGIIKVNRMIFKVGKKSILALSFL